MFKFKTGYLSHHPQLFYQTWHPSSVPHGLVLIVHGLGGHGGQFKNAALTWVEENWGIYALDLRGHGRSEGARGYINCWSEYIQDLAKLLEQVEQDYPNCPIMLWGHSLGGLIALDFALHYPRQLSGLILTAPAVGKTAVAPFKLILGVLLSRIYPRFSLESGFDSNACSRDPEMVQIYNTDPLRHHRGTARLATEFQAAQTRILDTLSNLDVPALILHGGGDRITCPDDSAALYEALAGGDCQFIQYPDAYHELHLETNRDVVLADILQWMQSNIKP